MSIIPKSITNLINELSRLPGIGEKTAARLTFHLLKIKDDQRKDLGDAVLNLRMGLVYCKKCFNLTLESLCPVCQDETRNRKIICVVAQPLDVVAIEKTYTFKGVYHILHGEISPLKGISPEELTIEALLQRLKTEKIEEVILGTNLTVEGEATSMYLFNKIKPFPVKITRIGKGLPMGCLLEYADEITILKALEGRKEI